MQACVYIYIFTQLLCLELDVIQGRFLKGINCPVSWDCRTHRMHLCRGIGPPNKCPGYDTKQSDGEIPVMLGLWGMRSTSSLPLLPGPLWPGIVAPDRALYMG